MPAPRFAPFVHVFVPFAFAIAAGNLYAEMQPNLTFARVGLTILIATAFAFPALVLFTLYDLRTAPPLVYRYWQLTWAFGFVAYALHAWYATGVWFEWKFRWIVEAQTLEVTVLNYVLLAAWAIDAGRSVVFGQTAFGRGYAVFQWAVHGLFLAAYSVAAIGFRSEYKSPFSFYLGCAMLAVVGVALLARLLGALVHGTGKTATV